MAPLFFSKPKLVLLLLLFLAVTGIQSIAFFNSTNTNLEKERIKLGRFLFYDTRLSYNQLKSCSSCHDPAFCFTDGYRTSAGADGYNVKRNAPSLINSVFLKKYTWADTTVHNFAEQMQFPMFNTDPKELGIKGNEKIILERFESDPFYKKQFSDCFPHQKNPINIPNIIESIAAFESVIISFDSKYDAYSKGNKSALNMAAKKGMQLFFSERLACSKCHMNVTLGKEQELYYANTGLYNVDSKNSYPSEDQGLYDKTGNEKDKGKFKIPSLRNVLLTAPYTHNGSVQTISEMIDIYARGGRAIVEGSYKGDGKLNANKHILIKGFEISKEEKTDLIAFLGSFTDTGFFKKKMLLNPFK